jgi:exopolysaccharide biosynthesis protein
MRINKALFAVIPIWLTQTSFRQEQIQVWEKPIAPGMVYRMEMESEPKRMIHIIKIISSSPVVSMMPELAGKTVYEGTGKGQGKVSDIVKETNAIAAINADFFPFTGDPLGLMVRRGTLLSLPFEKRPTFAWGPKESAMGYAKFSASVVLEDKREIPIDGFNQECPQNKITLNTPEAGVSKSPTPCLTIVLKVDGNQITPTTQIGATVVGITKEGANLPLGDGKFTLVAHGNKIGQIDDLKQGQRVTIKTNTTGFDWVKLENAVSGGSFIVREGEENNEYKYSGFPDDFSTTRHPRTAVGRTAEGDILFVTVDGRQKMSAGASLTELAEIMLRLGCRDAINLDGGGSSCVNIHGLNMNRPSDKTGERPVANGVAFYGPRLPNVESNLRIVVPSVINVNQAVTAKVIDAKGKEVPNIEILWSMQGAAWVDQGGQVTGNEAGNAELKAYVRGSLVSIKVSVR